METKYTDLYAMLNSNTEARQFFNTLPDYVRDHISSRAANVNTLSGLKAYGDNLLQGDK